VCQSRLIYVGTSDIHPSVKVGLLVRLWYSRSHGEFLVLNRRGEEE
jgi:hypothetical protein